jgi:hypothetical protein
MTPFSEWGMSSLWCDCIHAICSCTTTDDDDGSLTTIVSMNSLIIIIYTHKRVYFLHYYSKSIWVRHYLPLYFSTLFSVWMYFVFYFFPFSGCYSKVFSIKYFSSIISFRRDDVFIECAAVVYFQLYYPTGISALSL